MKDIVFRDGTRCVPDHVEDMIIGAGIETWQLTYRQVMDRVNEWQVQERLAKAQRDLLREHFRVNP